MENPCKKVNPEICRDISEMPAGGRYEKRAEKGLYS